MLWSVPMQKVLQAALFTGFFGIGAASVAVSVLSEDLIQYYHNRQLLQQAQKVLSRLESLNSDYDVLLTQLEKDPSLIKRIAPAALGAGYRDPNAVYPKARATELAAARKALLKAASVEPNEPVIPKWLDRAGEPIKRALLFICGAALVVIAVVCFSPVAGSARSADTSRHAR